MYSYINKLITSGLFSGYIPGAPGTYGSLVALLLVIFFPEVFTSLYSVVIIFVIGLLTSDREENISGIKDDPRIVIDEILGVIVAFCGIHTNFTILITGLILFRFFDIVKPFPINKLQNFKGGWGIMADDLAAGLFTRLILGGIIYGFF